MAYAFFLGVDVEEKDGSDRFTHTLLEKEKNTEDDVSEYRLDRIRQYDDTVSIDALADRVQSIVADSPYLGRTTIIINRQPKPGQALLTALEERGLDPIAATLTAGGQGAGQAGTDNGLHVSVDDAVKSLIRLYEEGRFAIEEYSTEAASRLARAIQHTFEVLDEVEGNQATREYPDHQPAFTNLDSHLTSAGLAAWLGTERSFDPSQHLKEDPQTGRP